MTEKRELVKRVYEPAEKPHQISGWLEIWREPDGSTTETWIPENFARL